MQETLLESAQFNPKIRSYYMLVGALFSLFTIIGIVFTPLVVLLIWLISDRMIKAMSAKLFERKLVVKRGIWFVVEKSIPLEKITDVALSQGPVMRIFGLYRLSFETAGQSAEGALVSMIGIIDAVKFREDILAQKDRLTSKENAQSKSLTSVEATHTDLSHSSSQALIELNNSVQRIESLLEQLVTNKSP